MLEIKELPREQWENYELAFSYETDGYYSFQVSGWDFSLTFNPYPAPVRREFTGICSRAGWSPPPRSARFMTAAWLVWPSVPPSRGTTGSA